MAELKQRKRPEGGPKEPSSPSPSPSPSRSPSSASRPPKEQSACPLFFILLACLVFIMAGGAYLFLVIEFQTPPFPQVKETKLELSDDFKSEIQSKRKPVIMRKVFAGNSLLKVQAFTEGEGVLPSMVLSQVQQSPSGVFASVDIKAPLAEVEYLGATGSLDGLVPVQASTFWAEEGKGKGKEQKEPRMYRYYDAPTSRDFADMAEALPNNIPLKKTQGLPPRFAFGTQGARVKPYMFLANSYYTLFDGEVDVILFPPTELHNIYPYPDMHLNGGSGQVFYSEPFPYSERLSILLRFPKVLSARGYKGTIYPGDILYIPPFWSCQLHFRRPSILLKTYSAQYESEVFQEFINLNVPSADSFLSQVQIVKLLLDWTLPKVADGLSSDEFIQGLLDSRYVPLYRDLKVETSTDFTPCRDMDEEDVASIREHSEAQIAEMVRLAEALQGESLKGVKLAVLEAYVEYLVQKTISAEDAYNFYVHCFNVVLPSLNTRSTAQDIE